MPQSDIHILVKAETIDILFCRLKPKRFHRGCSQQTPYWLEIRGERERENCHLAFYLIYL